MRIEHHAGWPRPAADRRLNCRGVELRQTWSEDTSIFNWQKAPSQRALRCFFKKRVAFALMLKSGSGGATRSGVEEKIRHNSLRSAFGTYSVFFFHSATRCALGVTRALQGKVLSADACWSASLRRRALRQMSTLRITVISRLRRIKKMK